LNGCRWRSGKCRRASKATHKHDGLKKHSHTYSKEKRKKKENQNPPGKNPYGVTVTTPPLNHYYSLCL